MLGIYLQNPKELIKKTRLNLFFIDIAEKLRG